MSYIGSNYASYNNYGQVRRANTSRQAFSNLTVNQMELKLPGIGGMRSLTINQKGYGVDLDGDGQFQGNKDGVLAFDLNGNGRIDGKEIQESRKRLKLLTETPKMGKGLGDSIKWAKQMKERSKLLKKYDRDGDGKLNAYELKQAGAKMVVDSNGDGKYSSNETQDISNIRTASGRYSFDALKVKGLGMGSNQVHQKSPWGGSPDLRHCFIDHANPGFGFPFGGPGSLHFPPGPPEWIPGYRVAH